MPRAWRRRRQRSVGMARLCDARSPGASLWLA
jgi:hypothetical protein